MADREQSKTKPRSVYEEQLRKIHEGAVVGRDVPDESKEHHTEIAVEAGRKGGEHRRKKN